MPTYEYRCEHCGDFEEIQRITDPPLTRCPQCRRRVRRLISSTSFQLKGSGWYVTDYARAAGEGQKKESPAAATGAADGAGDGKGASGSDGKADAKPASPGADKAAAAGTSAKSAS
jgi:putative FmdB family regulatory protein